MHYITHYIMWSSSIETPSEPFRRNTKGVDETDIHFVCRGGERKGRRERGGERRGESGGEGREGVRGGERGREGGRERGREGRGERE